MYIHIQHTFFLIYTYIPEYVNSIFILYTMVCSWKQLTKPYSKTFIFGHTWHTYLHLSVLSHKGRCRSLCHFWCEEDLCPETRAAEWLPKQLGNDRNVQAMLILILRSNKWIWRSYWYFFSDLKYFSVWNWVSIHGKLVQVVSKNVTCWWNELR